MGAVWVLLDQLSKWWAESELAGRTIDVVWTLRLRLVTNTGASFSLGEGLGPLIGLVALGVVGLLLWTGRSIGSRFAALGLGLVLGGALGNVLDRAFRGGDGFMDGAVIDFIDFQWWPVFNVADIGVVVGAVILVLASFRLPDEEGAAEPPAGAGGERAAGPTGPGADREPPADEADDGSATADPDPSVAVGGAGLPAGDLLDRP